MREHGWVATVLGGALGIIAAVGVFLLRNWLCHHAAVPLAVFGWLLTALLVYGITVGYLGTPKATRDISNVGYLITIAMTGIMGILVVLVVYHAWQGVGGSNRFAYLVVEAVFAAVVGYGFRQATDPLSDFLHRDSDDADEPETTRAILQSFDWLLALSSSFNVALMFGLIILEFGRPYLSR